MKRSNENLIRAGHLHVNVAGIQDIPNISSPRPWRPVSRLPALLISSCGGLHLALIDIWSFR